MNLEGCVRKWQCPNLQYHSSSCLEELYTCPVPCTWFHGIPKINICLLEEHNKFCAILYLEMSLCSCVIMSCTHYNSNCSRKTEHTPADSVQSVYNAVPSTVQGLEIMRFQSLIHLF